MWSSPYTWIDLKVPVDGDLVVIDETMKVRLDVNTARLAFLLIKGGTYNTPGNGLL